MAAFAVPIGFSLGFAAGSGTHGVGHPAIFVVAAAAALAGAGLRRMLWGGLAGGVVGFVGAAGILSRVAMEWPVQWPLGMGTTGVLSAMAGVVAGAVAGLVADLADRRKG